MSGFTLGFRESRAQSRGSHLNEFESFESLIEVNIDLLININVFYRFLTVFYTFYNESEIFKCKKFWFLNINSNITRKILGIFN